MDVTASHGRLSQANRDFIARRRKLLIGGQWADARPVVCAMPYDDDLDRIAKVGDATEHGPASTWTRDTGIAHKLKAGSVWINAHNLNGVAVPFGGYKQSGWAREMGYEAIEFHTETKAVAALP